MAHTGLTRPLETASERPGPKADYEKTLWRPGLSGAFPTAPLTRRGPTSRSTRLRALSNGSRTTSPSLREDHDRILEVTGAGSRLTRGRASSSSSRVPRLLDGVTDIDF